MQFIDTHIHLQDDKSNNTTEIIAQALAKGCQKLICASSIEDDWEQVAELTINFPQIIVPAFGVHPWYITTAKDGWQTRIEEYLQRFPQALIGEAGLDGLKPEVEQQKQLFAEHIKLAKEYQRPLIIHAVKAVPLLENFWKELPEKFVFHGFNSKAELLQKILQHGGYIGIGSGLLKTPKAKEILKQIPINRLLFETDAPYLALSPWAIIEQAEQIAALRGENADKLAQQVYHNSLEFIK